MKKKIKSFFIKNYWDIVIFSMYFFVFFFFNFSFYLKKNVMWLIIILLPDINFVNFLIWNGFQVIWNGFETIKNWKIGYYFLPRVAYLSYSPSVYFLPCIPRHQHSWLHLKLFCWHFQVQQVLHLHFQFKNNHMYPFLIGWEPIKKLMKREGSKWLMIAYYKEDIKYFSSARGMGKKTLKYMRKYDIIPNLL